MSEAASQTRSQVKPSASLLSSGLLQRQCACGSHTAAGGTCSECSEKEHRLQRKTGQGNGSHGLNMSSGIPLQRKLTIGASDDPLEKEADRVADQVMSMPSTPSMSQTSPRIQRFAGQPSVQAGTAPASVERVLAGSGKPLEAALRKDMESKFGYDFSQVRLHTGVDAAESARSIHALAYTVGRHVVFGAGQHALETNRGKRLLTHELVHVVQQSSVASLNLQNPHEHEASASAEPVLAVTPPLVRHPLVSPVGVGSLTIMRAPDECLDKCENKFNNCLASTNFPPQCIAERSNCQLGCAPTRKTEGTVVTPSMGNRSTKGEDVFERGVISAKNVKNDPKWVENEIVGDQLSDNPPWTYSLNYKDGSKLVIPLEQVFMERLAPATVTFYRKHKASGRIIPCVLDQFDPRLKTLTGPAGDFNEIAELATPRFDSITAPQIVSLVNAAQMLFLGKGMLEVLQVQAMNPLMGGGAAAAGRAGSRSAVRVGAGAVAKGTGGAAVKEGLTFVEIGAGDLKASLELAKKGGVKVVAVDPAAPAAAAIKELESLGGQFVKGVAADVAPGTADHVFQYFPWRITGTGSWIGGGTWRLVEDTVRLLKPSSAAHFVTEELTTARFLAEEASRRGLRAVITETTAGAAAPAASGATVPTFSKALKVWMVNIYK